MVDILWFRHIVRSVNRPLRKFVILYRTNRICTRTIDHFEKSIVIGDFGPSVILHCSTTGLNYGDNYLSLIGRKEGFFPRTYDVN